MELDKLGRSMGYPVKAPNLGEPAGPSKWQPVGPVPMEGYSEVAKGLKHGWINSYGVKLHYVTLGQGPLALMIHGAPDFWYTWRNQMKPVADLGYQVVAIDLRGYNQSDAPKGEGKYDLRIFLDDVANVITHFGSKKATIIAHDWGGFISWNFAMRAPYKNMVDKMFILNMLHPYGALREITTNKEQQKAAAYAAVYRDPKLRAKLTPEKLAYWIKDEDAEVKRKYVDAFRRSSVDGISSYYTRNFVYISQKPFVPPKKAPQPARVKAPVFFMFGLEDTHQMAAGLDGTEGWVDD